MHVVFLADHKEEEMSQDTPIILYIGDSETGQWFDLMLAPWQGYVYVRNELLSALGVYISYEPDLVILDARIMPKLAQNAYTHLRSVNAEHILILEGERKEWEHPANIHIQVMRSVSISDLLSTINNMLSASIDIHAEELAGCLLR